MPNISLSAQIRLTKESFSSTLDVCMVSKRASEIKSSAQETVDTIQETLEALPKHQCRKLKQVLNSVSTSLQGLVNGINLRELSLSDVRRSAKALRTRSISDAVPDTLEAGDSQESPGDEMSPRQIQKHLNSQLAEAASMQEALNLIRPVLEADRKTREDEIERVINDKEAQVNTTQARKLATEEAYKEKQILEVKARRRNLPQTFVGPFTVVHAPVVPIFMDKDRYLYNGGDRKPHAVPRNFKIYDYKFKEIGVPNFMVNDYVVLTDELLLAIKLNAYEEFENEHQEQNKAQRKEERQEHGAAVKADKARHEQKVAKLKAAFIKQGGDPEDFDPPEYVRPGLKKSNATKMDPVAFAELMVEHLNESSRIQYDLVSRSIVRNPRNAKIVFFWIMSKQKHSALQRAGWKNLKDWGLPF